MISGILQEMTIDEVREFKPAVVLFGIGSTEPHGPAMAYGTDYFNCDAGCRAAVLRANARGARVLMYPTWPIGNNVNFKEFPFAARIRVRTLMRMVLDVIAALEEDGIRKIVIRNGHGGNIDALQASLREHFEVTPPERRAFVCVPGSMGGPETAGLVAHPSPHGGESELSQLMHTRPDCVRLDKIRDLPIMAPQADIQNLDRVFYVRPWHRYLPASAGGNVSQASAEKGRRIFDAGIAGFADFLADLSRAEWHPGFPF